MDVRFVPWFFLAIVLSLLLRIPYLRVGMISDEGGYAYVARRWLEGRGTLYNDIWVSRPQGIFVVYAAIMRTIPGSSVVDSGLAPGSLSSPRCLRSTQSRVITPDADPPSSRCCSSLSSPQAPLIGFHG